MSSESAVDRARREDLDESFIRAMEQLPQKVDRLAHLLPAFEEPLVIEGTRATFRCHFLAYDGSGRPAVTKLARALADEVVGFCIPRQRLAEAIAEYETTGSFAAITRLEREARSLFTEATKSGEGGELLLYLLLESHLRIPQILCKMSLKTSSNVHVHGTDGVHALALPDGGLALYWGESKLHASVTSAIDDCFESIAPFLSAHEDIDVPRDLLLARDHLDAGEQELTARLVRFFDDRSPESLRLELRGACLVGFSLKDYPNIDDADVKLAITHSVRTWGNRVLTKITLHEVQAVEIELFCIPFPSVQDLRDAVRSVIKK